MKILILTGLVALNLSHAPVEGLNHHANLRHNTQLADNNPFSGARSFSITLDREDFTTPKEPIRFWEFWANDMNQTAQQMVAICSMLETEADLRCDIRLLHHGIHRER